MYESEAPSDYRLTEEMKLLDKDESGEVDRSEWMKHLCSADSTGKMIFRANLKAQFEKYDIDNTGALNYQELQGLLKESIIL